jgi:CheY-like chemotaxis protein
MNTPLMALPISAPIPDTIKKKRVLLVDGSDAKRNLRAGAMRNLGMDVDCAADIAEARSWWRAALYDLVLINMQKGRGHRDRFCDDVRSATPPQQLAFLVGKPEYLATSPNGDDELLVEDASDQAEISDVKAALCADLGHFSQRWGILEASRRISAVRSACTARSSAMRNRPVPPRDLEGPQTRRGKSTTLDDLLREELQ